MPSRELDPKDPGLLVADHVAAARFQGSAFGCPVCPLLRAQHPVSWLEPMSEGVGRDKGSVPAGGISGLSEQLGQSPRDRGLPGGPAAVPGLAAHTLLEKALTRSLLPCCSCLLSH